MKNLFFILLLLNAFSSFAEEKDFSLKVGGYYTASSISNIKISNEPPVGGGISSHVCYRPHEKWEYTVSSYLNFAKFKDVRIHVNESDVRGDGTFQSVTFGPTIRYYDIDHQVPIGTPYYALGAHAVMQSFKFGLNNVEVDGGRFNGENSLSSQGWGSLLAIGFDKAMNSKKKKNYFIELVYIANRTRRASEIANNNNQVRLIRSENSRQPIFEQTFFLGVGLTLF